VRKGKLSLLKGKTVRDGTHVPFVGVQSTASIFVSVQGVVAKTKRNFSNRSKTDSGILIPWLKGKLVLHESSGHRSWTSTVTATGSLRTRV